MMKRPEHIPTKIRLLTRARQYIHAGQARGLCYALQRDYHRMTSIEKAASEQLRAYILKVMGKGTPGGAVWLTDWQEANGFGKRSYATARQDRLDWIDWMIADYKKWGKA